MKARDIEKVEAVSTLLRANGYEPDGYTENPIPGVPEDRAVSSRRRFAKVVSIRTEYVTVGPRTVCFYYQYGWRRGRFVKFRTTELEAITREISKRGEESPSR